MKILILIFLLTSRLLQAQTDNCAVYEAVFQQLLDRENELRIVTIVPAGGFDPINPQSEVVETLYTKQSLYFYVMPYVLDFKLKAVKWFAEEVKDSSLCFLEYRGTKDTTINCAFNDLYRYQYSTDTEARFDETHFFQEGIGDSAVHFSPAKVAFSNVLYYKDELALVYIKTKIAIQAGRDATYLFVFEKRDGAWVLTKKAWLQG